MIAYTKIYRYIVGKRGHFFGASPKSVCETVKQQLCLLETCQVGKYFDTFSPVYYSEMYLDHLYKKNLGFLDNRVLVLEQTLKYQTLNTPNNECLNNELSEHHILAQNRTLNMSNITKN